MKQIVQPHWEWVVLKKKIFRRLRKSTENLKLNRKIQLSLLLIIIPLFIMCVLLFLNMYRYNQQYDRIIANTAQAGRFSIDFKKEYDYTIYLLIAGHSSFEEENPYVYIEEARDITYTLKQNTTDPNNRHRTEIILKLLGDLEKHTRRIEENKKVGGHYLDNINIWENDVQSVTALIQSTVLEYTYYETKGMEQLRLYVSESLGRITLISLVVFLILVITALFLSVIIPNSIVKPIHHLNVVTNQVAKGDLSVRANVSNGAEVKQLANSLNIMIEKIDILLKAVKEDERNLREAELELLQSQINPHFLYNTLDTIIWLAESDKQEQVINLVESLSDFFRTSLNHGTGMFTLYEEERHMRSYLKIQQVRYQDILNYEIDIPENLKDVILPKITLQPLIENALYHGIKNRRRPGMITVKAFKEENDVVITVEDNGIGMSEERLNQIYARFEHPKNSAIRPLKDSFGLYNVNERIKLKFGDSYGLTITSVYGEGTCIRVKIPFNTQEFIDL